MRALIPLALIWASCSDYGLTTRVTYDDPEACQEEPARYNVTPDPDCRGEPEIGVFEPVLGWNWSENAESPGFHQIMASPVVGQATDDNGDGQIDDADTPDVIFTAFSGRAYRDPGALVVISGDDGSLHWSKTDFDGARPYGASGVAIADLGDGIPTILVSSTQGLLAVEAATGERRWVADVPMSTYGHPAVADIDGDGVAEIVFGPSVVNADGTVRWTGTEGRGSGSFLSFAVDLDGDGLAEIVAGNTIYEHDGTVRWTEGTDGYPAVGDLDGDGVPEIITVIDGQIVVREVDGTLRWTFDITDGRGGPPTVADFDGDGLADIGVASREFYRVVRHDGTLLWENVVQDYSSARTGSSVFDFEGDGAAEVVYADEVRLFVWDGATGTEQLVWDGHASGTLWEYPLVVDVDGDGSTEIVVASNNYTFPGANGITIIRDETGTWAPSRKTWNQHAWHITNANDNGTIPASAPGNWNRWNSFRAGNSETKQGLGLADLTIDPPLACTLRCESVQLAEIWLRVGNRGREDAGPFNLTATRAGEDSAYATFRSQGVRVGEIDWLGPLEVRREDLQAGGIRLDLDPEGSVGECRLDNNELMITEWPCAEILDRDEPVGE